MPVPARTSTKSRIDEQTWIETALDMLATGGISAVRVEPLALKLGVTKGAFYSRYPTRDALLSAMLDYWRRVSTIDVLEAYARIDEPAEKKLERILKLSTRRADASQRGLMEMGIRIWADQDDRAAHTMEEIDAYRLGYFKAVLQGNGFKEAEAEARALLVYGYIVADACLSGQRDEATKRLVRHVLSGGILNGFGDDRGN